MSRSILQFLINNISNAMLSTATPENIYHREQCFKDLTIEEVHISSFTLSKKTGKWGCFLYSKKRRFDWPDKFSFKTQQLNNVLRNYSAPMKYERDLDNPDYNRGLYYVEQTDRLYYIVSPMTDITEGDLELGLYHIPKEMIVARNLSGKVKRVSVSHPYVQGEIYIHYRN